MNAKVWCDVDFLLLLGATKANRPLRSYRKRALELTPLRLSWSARQAIRGVQKYIGQTCHTLLSMSVRHNG